MRCSLVLRGGPLTVGRLVADVARWRRAWRDKILPALVNFKPDIIFVSAGFDAHRKDEINFRYIGIAEKEFEWLTEQIVMVGPFSLCSNPLCYLVPHTLLFWIPSHAT